MKLIKLLANLGYGSRKEVQAMIRSGWVKDAHGQVIKDGAAVTHEEVRFREEPIDPPAPLTIILNKPDGFTCSTEDPGETIYDLLPERFAHRKPGLNSIGRLDKDTTGLLLMTDDGKLLHRIIHPKHGCLKVYHATLDRPLEGHEAEQFASGTLQLKGDSKPLLPAPLEVLGDMEALVTLHEGRYHQVRRMFAAVGNHVVTLKRVSLGGLKLPSDLEEGAWRVLTSGELDQVFG
ncbi:MAG: pseudouridine synthase [Verrucomicrobiaceae bacterium]|jgi:16S rRNA pseudouridine516 synthase|nr:rRNA pseudouridine synthase [bacterium]MDC0312528.1 rRNA pseudouridine synthase [Verrucomicrobiales bacterium]NCF86312.1 pseudouridine synthase [Verrucomicrobiaceae bacterium]MDB4627172.1 rRNA pseudouridine synthase [bacterium]MDF1787670.1 pseudouridine synthase [Verrucomicrobiales bacterium]